MLEGLGNKFLNIIGVGEKVKEPLAVGAGKHEKP